LASQEARWKLFALGSAFSFTGRSAGAGFPGTIAARAQRLIVHQIARDGGAPAGRTKTPEANF